MQNPLTTMMLVMHEEAAEHQHKKCQGTEFWTPKMRMPHIHVHSMAGETCLVDFCLMACRYGEEDHVFTECLNRSVLAYDDRIGYHIPGTNWSEGVP